MKINKAFIFLKNKNNPFVFKIKFEKFIDLLNVIDEAQENEIINIENIYFIKKEFSYAMYK